ncbi:peptide deformylase [Paenibacillus dendritiformis]|uniref:peptide deformylase n=1 Tax=Paenibacillus dendritiformis TaxID=130049 RepID=UPI0018CCE9E0|nr:peptide deformylase [Paenibacillus dendritiformis]MBG9794528.1 peptide deformylase [Paenibacillus dendritiformis]
MAERAILPFGDPILRKVAKPVDEVTPRILKLLDDMVETLYASDGRAGLAAPQVGVLRRVIVMDCGEGLIELINPEIVELSGEQDGVEACLSFPGYYGHVKRANAVAVTSLDREGKPFTLKGEGYLARCIQHEIDHLNGVLFVDHVKDRWLYHEKTKQKIALLDVIRLTNQGV